MAVVLSFIVVWQIVAMGAKQRLTRWFWGNTDGARVSSQLEMDAVVEYVLE